MTDDRSKTSRTLVVADHLWEAFSTMAAEMGSDKEALINQALYTFARLNGFLIAADLKKLGASQPTPQAESSRPRPAPGGPPTLMAVPEPSLVEVDDALLGEEARNTSMELPSIAGALAGMKSSRAPMVAQHREEVSDPGTQTPGGRTLVLLADGRELDRVTKERFLIGRGKHCDLIINSGKVSREHAAITREGGVWFIEDLGSSNGTWFDKRRIGRRQIQEGDEYFICSEKLSCAFR
jgi:hypothetical protein